MRIQVRPGRASSRFTVTKTSQLETVRSAYYGSLADHFIGLLDLRFIKTVLEAGCGKGQLTIPLVKRLPTRIGLIAVDSSEGPYLGSLKTLASKLRSEGLERRVRPIVSNVDDLGGIDSDSIDALVSNELLCDLRNKRLLLSVFKEFHRILQPGGVMIHGEWSSSPDNEAQAIVIRADGHEGTDTPSRFWNPDEISTLMRKAGFGQVSASYFEANMSLAFPVALKELQDWGVRASFLKKNEKMLRLTGIQLPAEHVLSCRK